MNKHLAVLFTLLAVMLPVTAYGVGWEKIYEASKTVSVGAQKPLQGPELTSDLFDIFLEPQNLRLVNGNKKITIKSVFAQYSNDDSEVPTSITFYKGNNANSSPVYSLWNIGNGIVETYDFKGAKLIVESQKINLNGVETNGTIEQDKKVAPNKGVRYVYTTDWDDDFVGIEKKLVKITTEAFNPNKRRSVLYYIKGSKNFKSCVANYNTPFCFKKDGDSLVMSARSQMGESVTFWMK